MNAFMQANHHVPFSTTH